MAKTSKILIVEDNKLNATIMQDILIENGYITFVAHNGQDGLDVIDKEEIELVLLDWIMPGMDGLEVCKRIKNNPETKLISVIMVSSLTDLKKIISAFEAGVDDYIEKPVILVELLARVRSSLRISELHKKNLQASVEKHILKENLTTMIIHDLKNPLSTIQSVLDLWKSESALLANKEFSSHLEMVEHATTAITDMVMKQLKFSQLESGKYKINNELVDLNEMVRAIYLGNCHEFNKYLRFEYETMPEEFPKLFMDRELMVRTLTNLFTNAVRHTRKGFIKVSCQYDDPSQLTISVTDSGVGIHEEDIPHLFDKFYQAERYISSSTNFGIGLCFCDFAVKAMGGEINVASNPGKGSDFTFTIPAMKGEGACITYNPLIEHMKRHGASNEKVLLNVEDTLTADVLPELKTKVLLVDDSHSLRRIMKTFLKKMGIINVDEARDGKMAVNKVAEKNFDIIFCDITMPIMTGLEATEIIRKNHPDLKIVMLTAEPLKQEEARKIGVNDYLTKPFTLDKIRGCLKKLEII